MEYKKYTSLAKANEYSQDIISKIEKEFDSLIKSKGFCIVTTGSFARYEASAISDLDCFIITENGIIDPEYFTKDSNTTEITPKFKDLMKKVVDTYIIKDAGDTGTFGLEALVSINDLITNIGGTDDSNVQFTRRMLFLLEGKCLYNQDLFNKFRQQLIETYIKETVSDAQLSRFFLNDIIRFYRTMTTDFEHKVAEKSKSWGVRNIKLTFSRKLLYFGGIITVAETAQKTRDVKIKETLRLLEMTPLERIEYISKYRVDKVFKLYDYFLMNLSNDKIREELDKANIEFTSEENPAIFRKLKNESKHFSWALELLLKQTYADTHPIHHALVF